MKKYFVKTLLICGVAAVLLRVATDIISAIWYPGYSFINQSMSQLAAIGAPTRQFQLFLLAADSFLFIAFGLGVLVFSKRKPLRITGILLLIYGAIGLAQQFIPSWSMQLDGGASANSIHIVVTAAMLFLILLFIGIGAASQGKGFRLYSVATILILLIFGALGAMKASQTVQFSAPWLGALERISYYSHLIWILVFALILLQIEKRPDSINGSDAQ